MKTKETKDTDDLWDTRQLGAEEEYVQIAPKDHQADMDRLQKELRKLAGKD